MSSLISKVSPCVTTWANTTLRKVTRVPSLKETKALQTLQNLNQYTLEVYARQKAKVKDQLGKKIPVILANQNHLSSRYRHIRRDVEYVPEQYHLLKALAHIPIAIHTTRQMQDTRESDRLLSKLEGLFRPHQQNPNAT